MDRACAAEGQQQHSQNFKCAGHLKANGAEGAQKQLVRNIRKGAGAPLQKSV